MFCTEVPAGLCERYTGKRLYIKLYIATGATINFINVLRLSSSRQIHISETSHLHTHL